jgi:glycosyltransferase involved in cell wall biosynthesis
MKRKKILWLCSWYPGKTEPFNGDFIQRHARAAALYNDIHVIHVIGDSSGQIQQTTKEIAQFQGLTEHIIYIKKSTSFWGRVKAHYQWLFLFRQAIRKYMVENKKPDGVHVHIPYKAGLPGIWFKKKYKIPFVVSEHWGIYNEVELLNYSGRSARFKRFTQQVFKTAVSCISVSQYLADGVNRLVCNMKFEVIHNVVDTDLFFFKEKERGAFRFIHVSNMVPLKNVEGILMAYKLLLERGHSAELHLVGNTNDDMKSYAANIGLKGPCLIFHGEVPYSKVAVLMQQSDCLLVNSNIENSPCVIGEALCCGLPVIATGVGGIPELIDKTNALLIVPGNDTALAQAMQQMLERHPQYDEKKIAEAAQSKFSYPVIGKKFDEIYRSAFPVTAKQ